MRQETIERIKAWLYDFRRKDDNGEYVFTDGDMVDIAYKLFEQIIKEEELK